MFWSSMTSTSRNTAVAPRPIPAAPAIPSMVRGRVHNPGSMLTAASPITRMIPQTIVSTTPPSSREASENNRTAMLSSRPSLTEPATMAGTALMVPGGHPVFPAEPGHQHQRPGHCRQGQERPTPAFVVRPPAAPCSQSQQNEGECRSRMGNEETFPAPQRERKGPIAPAGILLELIDLRQGIQGGEQGTEGEQNECSRRSD